MAMRDYITINNYSGLGTIGFSRQAIAAIAQASLKEVDGASIFGRKGRGDYSINSGVRVVFTKEGKAAIKMDVNLSHGVNVHAACERIQQTVATAVTLMCDMVPFDVQVKVMRIV